MFRSLMVYLSPVIPGVASGARAFLNEDKWQWQDASSPLLGATLSKFKPLLTRVEADQVARMVEQSKESTPVAETEQKDDYISIDDFAKVDLRIAKIEKAEPVEGADKLLALTLDVGDSQRQVFAGIKAAYDPDYPGWSPRDRRGQPRPAEDALRRVGRHGAGGGPGRRGYLPAVTR